MTVKRKNSKKKPDQFDIEDIINRGGKTKTDMEKKNENIRFTLRIPEKLLGKLDLERKKGFGSRNQWILEAIASRCNYEDLIEID